MSGASVWNPAPARLVATGVEVHVWRFSLDLPLADVERLAKALSEDERARAGRFVFDSDRRCFAVARGTLRDILGRYLGIPSGDLVFAYSSHGKPVLARGAGGSDLRFNVSHADGLALVAVALAREVGIDIERVREDFATDEMAARVFSLAELATIRMLPAAARCAAFFNCWTRKEAYVKARGEGLSLPLQRFDVSVAPNEPAELLASAENSCEVYRWSLQDLQPEPGYVAALAVEGHGWRLRCWTLPEKRFEGRAAPDDNSIRFE
jgi:4'-phosphopantetheinyl transferase